MSDEKHKSEHGGNETLFELICEYVVYAILGATAGIVGYVAIKTGLG